MNYNEIEFEILKLLNIAPNYGYALYRALKDDFSIHNSSEFYKAIRKMKSKGLIKVTSVEKINGRNREILELTSEGYRAYMLQIFKSAQMFLELLIEGFLKLTVEIFSENISSHSVPIFERKNPTILLELDFPIERQIQLINQMSKLFRYSPTFYVYSNDGLYRQSPEAFNKGPFFGFRRIYSSFYEVIQGINTSGNNNHSKIIAKDENKEEKNNSPDKASHTPGSDSDSKADINSPRVNLDIRFIDKNIQLKPSTLDLIIAPAYKVGRIFGKRVLQYGIRSGGVADPESSRKKTDIGGAVKTMSNDDEVRKRVYPPELKEWVNMLKDSGTFVIFQLNRGVRSVQVIINQLMKVYQNILGDTPQLAALFNQIGRISTVPFMESRPLDIEDFLPILKPFFGDLRLVGNEQKDDIISPRILIARNPLREGGFGSV